jgi:hypothetical protein
MAPPALSTSIVEGVDAVKRNRLAARPAFFLSIFAAGAAGCVKM